MKFIETVKLYLKLPKTIFILFMVRIINAMGNFVFPFLTIFLTKSMGMSNKKAGLYLTFASLAFAPGSIIGGKMADHFGRKKTVILFQLLAISCFIPCAFLGNSIIVPWILILSALFNGAAQPASGAIVNDLTDRSNRKMAYSLLYLGNNIGFAIGPMIAGFLYVSHVPWIFLGNAFSGLIVIIILIIFVPETIPNQGEAENDEFIPENEKAQEGSLFKVLLKKPQLLMFALLSTVYSFVYAQYPFCIPIQVNEIFGKKGPQLYAWLMTTNGLVVIIFTTIIVSLTHKLRPLFNVALAGIFFACGFGMLYFVHSYTMFVFSTIIWTIGEILNATNSGVYIANHTPMSHRGRFNAVIPLITGAGFALGPFVMGRIIQGENVRIAWPIVFIVEIAAAVLIFVLFIQEKRKEGKSEKLI